MLSESEPRADLFAVSASFLGSQRPIENLAKVFIDN